MSIYNFVIVPTAASTPNLQAVTNVGNTTNKEVRSFDSITPSSYSALNGSNVTVRESGSQAVDIFGNFSGAGPGVVIYDLAGMFRAFFRANLLLAGNITLDSPTSSGKLALVTDIPATPTLQAVTTAGNTTSNQILTTNAFVASAAGNSTTATPTLITQSVTGAGLARLTGNGGGTGGAVIVQQTGTTFSHIIEGNATLATADRFHQLQNENGTIAHLANCFLQPHIKQTSGAAPTIALGAAAGGAGAVIAITNCTDTSGHVLITTGAVPLALGTLFTITFGTAFSNSPVAQLYANNQLAGALYAAGQFPFQNYSAVNTASVTFTSNAVALAALSQYSFSYLITG